MDDDVIVQRIIREPFDFDSSEEEDSVFARRSMGMSVGLVAKADRHHGAADQLRAFSNREVQRDTNERSKLQRELERDDIPNRTESDGREYVRRQDDSLDDKGARRRTSPMILDYDDENYLKAKQKLDLEANLSKIQPKLNEELLVMKKKRIVRTGEN